MSWLDLSGNSLIRLEIPKVVIETEGAHEDLSPLPAAEPASESRKPKADKDSSSSSCVCNALSVAESELLGTHRTG